MVDFEKHLGAVQRQVADLERDGRPAKCVTLIRRYDTDVDDLWDAATNPERLIRWFLPVEGDLRVGGRYQTKGNAGGVITRCERPRALDLTWEFGGEMSWVELRLSADGDSAARLELRHIAPVSPHWETYGPGATGVGWEFGLVALGHHFADPEMKIDETALAATPESKAFVRTVSAAWGEADIAAGADAAASRAAAERTRAFYSGEAPPQS